MNKKNLKQIYNNLLNSYTDEKTINIFWNEIAEKYSSSKRYYHNLNHINELVSLLNIYKSSICDLEIVQLAIFYHDVIYNAIKKDNEFKSAIFCKKHLEKTSLPKEKLEKCYNYILATKNHETNNENDLNYLLDFDLSILSSQDIDYEIYLKQIRKEYSFFPDIIYNAGRKKVLQYFLKQKKIYKTDEFYVKFEKKARENLNNELIKL